MKNIRFYTIENELYYKGKSVLKYTIEYPEIIKINNSAINTICTINKEANRINKNIRKDVLKMKNLFENEIYNKICKNFFYLINNKNTYNIYCLCNLFKENNKHKMQIDIEIERTK